jgi:hypothetical protein
MIADFMSKPLQGHLFVKFKKMIMGHTWIDLIWYIYIFAFDISSQ